MQRVLVAILLAVCCAGAMGDEEGGAAKPVSWDVPRGRDLAASPDGAWLAAWSPKAGCQLFPTAGGPPIPLADGEELASEPVFTADSAWVVTRGSAPSTYLQGVFDKRTQLVHLFPVKSPSKPKRIVLQMRMQDLGADIRKRLPPEHRDLKRLAGGVDDMMPLSGARMLFDRGKEGPEVWDIASQTKYAAAAALEGPSSCGLSVDGSKCVVAAAMAIEIRDVKQNRVLKSIPVDRRGCSELFYFFFRRPRFTLDATRVVATRSEVRLAATGEESTPHAVLCWSAQDGKLLWTAPLGECGSVHSVDAAVGHVVVHADDRLVVLRESDGQPVPLSGVSRDVGAARASHDGTAVWVCADDRLFRVDLPRSEAK